MSNVFNPIKKQRVRLVPSNNPNSLTKELEHMVGIVVELEPSTVLRSYPNGGKTKEAEYTIPYEQRGAYVTFGNHPERYRIPLHDLLPA